MGGIAGDRCGDDRRHVGGAARRRVRPRARPPCGSGAHGSAGYAYAGSRVRARVERRTGDDRRAARAIGQGRPRRGVDRRRRARAPGANGETMWLQTGIAALPGTPPMVYAEITRPGGSPVFLPLVENVAGRREPPARGARDEPPAGRLARLGRREARDRPGRPPRLAPDLEADRDGRVVERRRRDLQRLRLPLRAGRRRQRRSAARGGRSSPGFTFEDRGYVVRQLRPAPARPADASVRPDPGRTRSTRRPSEASRQLSRACRARPTRRRS